MLDDEGFLKLSNQGVPDRIAGAFGRNEQFIMMRKRMRLRDADCPLQHSSYNHLQHSSYCCPGSDMYALAFPCLIMVSRLASKGSER